MNRFMPSLALLALAYLPTVTPVYAQAPNRTFVSALGNDSNDCSIAAPCRHMQAAHNVTAPGGEIDVLDVANYGSITITKSISILGHGWASMTGSTGAVINITTSARIMLQGLIIDAFGLADQGILMAVSGELSVLDCTVRDAVQTGIAITSNSEAHVTIANTVVADNRGDGIAVQGSGAGITGVSLDHVQLIHNGGNTGAGLRATGGNAAFSSIVINSSMIAVNGIGIVLSQTGANAVTVFAVNSQIVNNQTSANIGPGNTFLVLEKTSIASLRNGITNSGQIISYGDNAIRDNITGNGLTAASPGLR